MFDWTDFLQNAALAALSGFAGLLGYTMRTLDADTRPNALRATVEALSSAVIGFIVIMVCRAFNLDSNMTGALCGLFGWMGAPASIRVLEKLLKEKLGVTNDDSSRKQ